MREPIRAVLLDIEGTTTPIAFVHDVLFPFARTHLPGLLHRHADDPAVAEQVTAVRRAAPGHEPLAVLLGWMDADAKEPPLKALQGMAWRQGYADGVLHGQVYPDVAPCLRRWREAGRALLIYSSGSVEAQRLLFGHSTAGDLRNLFSGHFDTTTGPKRSAGSYGAIATAAGLAPASILFLSDMEAELDAAAQAGLATCQLARPNDGTVASGRHRVAADFAQVEALFSLSCA